VWHLVSAEQHIHAPKLIAGGDKNRHGWWPTFALYFSGTKKDDSGSVLNKM